MTSAPGASPSRYRREEPPEERGVRLHDDAVLAAVREHPVPVLPVEQVVDDLVDDDVGLVEGGARLDELGDREVRDADRPDPVLLPQALQGAHRLGDRDVGVGGVDEDEVGGGPPELLEAPDDGGPDLLGPEVLPGDLRGEEKLPRVGAGPGEDLAKESLRPSGPVHLGGVEPRHPGRKRVLEGRPGPDLRVPVPSAERPEAEAEERVGLAADLQGDGGDPLGRRGALRLRRGLPLGFRHSTDSAPAPPGGRPSCSAIFMSRSLNSRAFASASATTAGGPGSGTPRRRAAPPSWRGGR